MTYAVISADTGKELEEKVNNYEMQMRQKHGGGGLGESRCLRFLGGPIQEQIGPEKFILSQAVQY